MRCKSSFIRNFPKGVEEKTPREEKTQREQGRVRKALSEGSLAAGPKSRYFINEDFCCKCRIILSCFFILPICSPPPLSIVTASVHVSHSGFFIGVIFKQTSHSSQIAACSAGPLPGFVTHPSVGGPGPTPCRGWGWVWGFVSGDGGLTRPGPPWDPHVAHSPSGSKPHRWWLMLAGVTPPKHGDMLSRLGTCCHQHSTVKLT